MAFPVLQDLDPTLQNTLLIIGSVMIASAIAVAIVATLRRTKGQAPNATALLVANLLLIVGVAPLVAAVVVAIHGQNEGIRTYEKEMISYVQQEYDIKVPSDWSAFNLGSGASVDVTDSEGRPLTVRFTELDTKNPKLWSQDYKEIERLRN